MYNITIKLIFNVVLVRKLIKNQLILNNILCALNIFAIIHL